jgi:hypothetical protein
MNSQKKYKISLQSALEWAKHELDAVGRIASIEDTDIQYTYAMCTVNGMLHLRKALMDLSENPTTQERARTLQTLDEVDRVITHLIKDYGVDLNSIRAFNTRKIMGNISKFNSVNTTRRNTRLNVGPVAGPVGPVGPVPTRPLNARPLNARPLNAKPLNARSTNAKPTNVKPKGLLSFLGF